MRVTQDNISLQARVAGTLRLLARAVNVYSRTAASAKQEAVIGSLASILLLLSVFALFYRRAQSARSSTARLLVENERLLAATADEAVTDPLTQLGNRRAFKRDLERMLPSVSAET